MIRSTDDQQGGVDEPGGARRGDRGSATVLALTLSFVFMAGAFIWLSATVDQTLHDRTQAAAVAFQAARAGAQQVDESAARRGVVVIDRARAVSAARSATARLLAGAGDRGALTAVRISGPRVTVTVAVTTGGKRVTGSGSATATIGFDRGGG